jgi:hypothetical protein
MAKQKLTRPNKKCLTCDSQDLKKPPTLRKFMYCGKVCADHANMKINIFATPIAKGKSGRRNTRELCLTYFVLRTRNEPLTSKQIFDIVVDLFGHNVLGRRAKSFSSLFHYFSNLKQTKKGGVYHYEVIDKKLSFRDSLKPKYNIFVFGDE